MRDTALSLHLNNLLDDESLVLRYEVLQGRAHCAAVLLHFTLAVLMLHHTSLLSRSSYGDNRTAVHLAH